MNVGPSGNGIAPQNSPKVGSQNIEIGRYRIHHMEFREAKIGRLTGKQFHHTGINTFRILSNPSNLLQAIYQQNNFFIRIITLVSDLADKVVHKVVGIFHKAGEMPLKMLLYLNFEFRIRF